MFFFLIYKGKRREKVLEFDIYLSFGELWIFGRLVVRIEILRLLFRFLGYRFRSVLILCFNLV